MRLLFQITGGVVFFFVADCFLLVTATKAYWLYIPLIFLFILINVIPSPCNYKIKSLRLRICADGAELLSSFLIASVLSAIYHITVAFILMQNHLIMWLISAAIAIIVLSVVFWNGIIRVYCTSVQLGIKHRVIGVLLGFIPIANIFALFTIISVSSKEAQFEYEKQEKNKLRAPQKICRTKYPILLVHGVFFRDFKTVNYWGRIPAELKANGAQIYYGNHQSALSVKDSAVELTRRIEHIVKSTGCEKINVIAHSKGGLDCRYAISLCGADKYVASLTTINTPHRGCLFADYLLSKAPVGLKDNIARTYNSAFKKLGDENPDFLSAVYDLTAEKCKIFNENVPDKSSVLYQSTGSKLNRAVNGKFPLNFSYHLVKYFDGDNDGLVSKNSFQWGSSFRYVTVKGKRGVSHGDMVDLNRENIPEFDVREFYVDLVADLKNKGL